MVVVPGVISTEVPEVTEAAIWLPPKLIPIVALPLVNTGVSFVELPAVIAEALGVSEVATGAAITVTVVETEVVVPALLVTVSV